MMLMSVFSPAGTTTLVCSTDGLETTSFRSPIRDSILPGSDVAFDRRLASSTIAAMDQTSMAAR